MQFRIYAEYLMPSCIICSEW